ncbi:MAG: 3-deoxy-manno-octulosonate cytidylyltransferase [Bacteroidia bacterium]|nr:3-deoxy-manno-octulosonate cytidylyltransferase [Bacteroidia bacterium]
MKILGLIPARYASTRFPGKPLVDINGKTMIMRVYEQSAKIFEFVYIATDDSRIYDHVINCGGKAVMTLSSHQSGTDRCAEALDLISEQLNCSFDIVVNIQGDEPFINPLQLELLVSCFEDDKAQIATLVKVITNNNEVFDSNKPKVILDKKGKAIYFSRSPIPYLRNVSQNDWVTKNEFYKHIGLYAYRANILHEIIKLPVSKLEKAESLEQLRWIENGYKINTKITEIETLSVDTPEDLKNISLFL